MKPRSISAQTMFERLAANHTPLFSFDAWQEQQKGSFDQWKTDAFPKVIECLGAFPESVPPDPELIVEWDEDGVHKQKYFIDVSPFASVAFQVNIPGDWQPGTRLPAILCWHGHGPFGKESVMGNRTSDELRTNIAAHNYDYGLQMAKLGFVTFAIDWMGCGERAETNKPHWRLQAGSRDWCNLYYLHATMLGMTSISINVAHGRAATDFACTLPCVDPNRLGVMGLSGGGTMTLWSTLCDERFRASEIICYCDQWHAFGIRDINYCGMQVAPGLFRLVDLPDAQGLIAPRPLCIDIGVYDTCFRIENTRPAFDRLARIYQAAGASDRLELDLFPGEHAWGGNRGPSFFRKYLDA